MKQDSSNQTHQLEVAFNAFNQMSEQLEESYQHLEDQTEKLNSELAASNSERIKQLTEKERLANRLAHLHDLLPGGIVVVDGNGFVSECNSTAVELFGEQILNQRWHQVIQRAIAPISSVSGEVTFKNGRKLSVSTRSLDTEPGQIVLLMDITEQCTLQEVVKRKDRLAVMGEMAASLAHQVRTPLSSALLYLSNLGNPDLPAQYRSRFIDKIAGRLQHLERMVKDMLQFARGGSFEMEDILVQELVYEFKQTLDPQLQQCNGQLEVNIYALSACVHGNREALLGVLLNLATNAIQACSEDIKLCLEVKHNKNNDVIILLHDNGPGIPEDIQEELFVPFFTTRSGGTGLGLSVALAVINAHHGEIHVDSKVGDGSSFIIRLPTVDMMIATRGDSSIQSLEPVKQALNS
ncbi:MAG: PAS domain-containing sensor histidine kinase [Gammaproteobacteria bacterium]|nr:PAS domain-containing sensor histidine kinase [Gammaproteobacteria bacterium]